MNSTDLAYFSTVWTIRALWNLKHTKRRFDQDDVRPMSTGEWNKSIHEARLSVLRLQANLDKRESLSHYNLFFLIENIHSDMNRISKEILYLENVSEPLVDLVQQLDTIRTTWESHMKIQDEKAFGFIIEELDHVLDTWVSWLMHFEANIVNPLS